MPNENRADPREGVRFAYLILNPYQTDQDYEAWLERHQSGEGELGHHGLFADLCENAISSNREIERYQERAICFAGGYHTAMSHIAVALDYVTGQREASRCDPAHDEEVSSDEQKSSNE